MLGATHDAGRYPRCWALPTMLGATHDAGRYPRCWALPTMLGAAHDAGRYPRCWALPTMLGATHGAGRLHGCDEDGDVPALWKKIARAERVKPCPERPLPVPAVGR